MTQLHKQTFQRMNLDADVRYLKPGEYRTLTNGIPINGIIENPNDFNINNIFGNELVAFTLPSGTNTVIGFLEDKAGGRAFYFMHNASSSIYNSIYQYSNGSISLVFRSDLLAFTATQFVDADIIGDLLVFTNGTSEIFKIKIGYTYVSPTINDITLIKRPPQLPLTVSVGVSGTFTEYRLGDNSFQFYYQYVYLDGQHSVFSATSQCVTVGNGGPTYNEITVTIPATEVIPATVKDVVFAVRRNGTNEFSIYRTLTRASVVAVAYHYFRNDVIGATVPDSEAFKWSDSVPNTCKSLRIFKNRIFTLNNTEGYEWDINNALESGSYISVVSGFSGYSLKARGSYGVGLVFFDDNGRLTNAIDLGRLSMPDHTYAAYSNKTIRFDFTVLNLSPTTWIPSWAKHYAVVRTKCQNISFFLQDISADMFYYKKSVDGVGVETITFNKDFTLKPDGFVVDIGSLVRYGIGYTLNPGDRIRIYSSGSTVEKIIESQDGRFIYCGYDANTDGFIVDATNPTKLFYEIFTPKSAALESYYETGNKYKITNPGEVTRQFGTVTDDLRGDVTFFGRAFTYTYASGGSYSKTLPYSNTMATAAAVSIEKMNPFDTKFNIWHEQTGRSLSLGISKQQLKTNYIRFGQPYSNSSLDLLNVFEALDDYALPIENGAGLRLVDDGSLLIAVHEVATGSIYVGDGFVKTTDGAQFLAKTDNVIGDDRTYLGSQGSTIPKSIAVNDGRVYFLDLLKGHIIRRSQDGLTRISDYGVRGYIAEVCRSYRDYIGYYDICASWDPQYECYVISFLQTAFAPLRHNQVTLYFHEKTNSWVASSNFQPRFLGTFRERQIAFVSGQFWLQSIHDFYNNWFGVQYDRTLEWEIGQDSIEKIWESIEVDADSIYDTAGTNEVIVELWDKNPRWTDGAIQTRINYADFIRRGSAYRSAFFRWISDINFASETESKYKSVHAVRGQSAYLTITHNGTERNPMKSITVGYRPSMNTNP